MSKDGPAPESMGPGGPMIRISGLQKTFTSSGGRVTAVQGIDLEVRERELVVLLGPSGCGKTTTLRCVAGLERPEAGSIELDGETVDAPADGRFVPPERRNIGMVFQSYAVWPHLDVFHNVALPLTQGRRKAPRHEVAERVLTSLHLVRLDGMENRPVTDLSGGQQQRVALARALVTRPRVLLMDEPLSNLDARLRDAMRTELKRLTQELGVTTLYVTHDQVEALSLGDRICVLQHGRILQQGTAEAVYNQPTDLFVAQFLGDVNLIPGALLSSDSVRTTFGMVRCRPLPGMSAGAAVVLAIRPEQIALERSAREPCPVDARVLTRLFVGDGSIWQVDVAGQTLTVRVRGSRTASPGDEVQLFLPDSGWLAFPTEAATPLYAEDFAAATNAVSPLAPLPESVEAT